MVEQSESVSLRQPDREIITIYRFPSDVFETQTKRDRNKLKSKGIENEGSEEA